MYLIPATLKILSVTIMVVKMKRVISGLSGPGDFKKTIIVELNCFRYRYPSDMPYQYLYWDLLVIGIDIGIDIGILIEGLPVSV